MKHFTGPRGGNDAFGYAMNSQAHRINVAMSTNPRSTREISALSQIEHLPRIRQHMISLVKRLLVERRDGGWALTEIGTDLSEGRAPVSKTTIERELEQVAVELEKEEYFSSGTPEDERRRQLRAIVMRQGQGRFREGLMRSYGRRCAITACNAVEALDAAHIKSYTGPKSNQLSNGLLLRSDIHVLFDLDLIAISPVTLRVVLADSLKTTSYAELLGKKLRRPLNPASRPDPLALDHRWRKFALSRPVP